jgi:excinuclease UvrABC helicase subunit UvrB
MEKKRYQHYLANTNQRREKKQEYRDPYGHVPMELDATIKSKSTEKNFKEKKKF